MELPITRFISSVAATCAVLQNCCSLIRAGTFRAEEEASDKVRLKTDLSEGGVMVHFMCQHDWAKGMPR